MSLDTAVASGSELQVLASNKWLGVLAGDYASKLKDSHLLKTLLTIIWTILDSKELEKPHLKELQQLIEQALNDFNTVQPTITKEVRKFMNLKKPANVPMAVRKGLASLSGRSSGLEQYIKVSVLTFVARALEALEIEEVLDAWNFVWEARGRLLHIDYAMLLKADQERNMTRVAKHIKALYDRPKELEEDEGDGDDGGEQEEEEEKHVDVKPKSRGNKGSKKGSEKKKQAQTKPQTQSKTQSKTQSRTQSRTQSQVGAIVVKLSGGPHRQRFPMSRHMVMAEFQKLNNEVKFAKSPTLAVTHIVIPDHVDQPSMTSAKSGMGNAVVMKYSEFKQFIQEK